MSRCHAPCPQEAVALVSKLQYNDLFDPAVKRVFGKTLVCRTLEAASQLAKSDELDCVTLDGERMGCWLCVRVVCACVGVVCACGGEVCTCVDMWCACVDMWCACVEVWCVCVDMWCVCVEVVTMTPAGDQVSRRGALTGGYQDARKSRMEAWRRVDEQKKKLEAEEAEKHDIASKVQDILSLHVSYCVTIFIFPFTVYGRIQCMPLLTPLSL